MNTKNSQNSPLLPPINKRLSIESPSFQQKPIRETTPLRIRDKKNSFNKTVACHSSPNIPNDDHTYKVYFK